MEIHKNYQLKGNNTFGIPAICSSFIEYEGESDLVRLYKDGLFSRPWMSLGYGANLLFCGDYEGTILHSVAKNIIIMHETGSDVLVRVEAGCVLDDFIAYAVDQDWGGMENLSSIPCSVGAAPVQNVGAYGVEAKDVIDSVLLFDTADGSTLSLPNADCEFGYRNSFFKSHPQYIVLSVDFRLTKAPFHRLCLDYGNLRSALDRPLSPEDKDALRVIRETVRQIRHEKLPDPAVLGSAGSFFKNPVVERPVVDKLLERYPKMPFYEMANGCKIPAGWLIEQSGWKGKREGNVGVYEKQALVLVNYGGATGADVWSLAQNICSSVRKNFGVEISPEVIRVPFAPLE